MNILIVGASGNLGSHLTRSLVRTENNLRLLVHKRPLPPDILEFSNVSVVKGDLETPQTLLSACREIDCVVYFAGVLFRPLPELFLPKTNTQYAKNIVDASIAEGVKKFILVSFPHVEGESSPERPAQGSINANPKAVHARTRLAAEQYLFDACSGKEMIPLVLRAGIIYGKGVKLMETARWLLRYRMLAIWNDPTWVHLLSLPDLIRSIHRTMESNDLYGIYNICDEQPIYLQEFLDRLAAHWGYPKPWRFPRYTFYLAACISEMFGILFRTASPLNRDIVRMGMTSVVADISRMKQELFSELNYPTLKEGIRLL